MVDIAIRRLVETDLDYISGGLVDHFGATQVVSRGKVHECLGLEGYVAWQGSERVGFVQHHIEGAEMEVVAIVSDKTGRGIGRMLLDAVVACCRQQELLRCWLITTNNNQIAIRFYEQQGWRLVAVHADAMLSSRRIKPEIPLCDSAGVPIRDELEFEYPFERSD